jgi:AcrR family transcriptional regulator
MSTRTYRGVSAEERRAGRRARLIESGLDLLGSGGLDQMTMTAVCGRAGLTERYFYESFRNLDDLLGAIFDATYEEARQRSIGALDDAPPDLFERSRAAVGALISVLTEDPRKARAYVESIGSQALRGRRDAAVRWYAGVLADQMCELAAVDRVRCEAQLTFATTMLVGGLAEAVIGWLDGTISLSRAELVDEAARLCVAAAEAVVCGG